MAAGPAPRVRAALAALPESLRPAAAGHVDAILGAADPLPAPGPWCDSLPGVCAASDFAALALARHPALLADLVDSGDLMRDYGAGEWDRRAAAAAAGAGDEAGLKRALRGLRRREMVRIAWRDLAGWAPLPVVLAELTGLADACLEAALGRLQAWEAGRRGRPRDGAGRSQGLVVLALGKLGGRELNFSSDIDLVFAYPEEGGVDGARALSCQEYFTHLGRRLIQVLGEVTEDGFVFRVDMRLRPNGESGPLVLSFDATEHYYQTHGREWERFALVKARLAAGDRAGEGLLARLAPFVYRRYVDYGAVEALREMKALIERELKRKGLADNIKLGPGGIREAEFVVQALQLIRGGREPALRQVHWFDALAALRARGLLPAEAAARLAEGYAFLRRVEHRLQMAADRQTQTLPADAAGLARLAYAMGRADVEGFLGELERRRRAVQEAFERLFAAPQREAAATPAEPLRDVWLGALDPEAAVAVLRRAGYPEPEPVLELLVQLRRGKAYGTFSAQGRDRMDRLVPLLLAAAGLAPDPLATLRRLVRLLEAIGGRTVYLSLLVENPMALSQLVRLCGASPWIANYLARHPVLLDELLHPDSLYRPPGRAALADELRRLLAHLPEEDLEAQMEALREFRHGQVLRVAAADVTGALEAEAVGRRLSEIAEVVLAEALALARRDLVRRHGEPPGAGPGGGLAVVAYGKLGGREMGYGSDLDLVFLADDGALEGQTPGPRPVANGVFFTRVAQRCLHILGAHTPAGVLYEVDTRLRPNGQAGPLVPGLAGLERYLQAQAWTWEHQALVRARPVAGDPRLGAAFGALREAVLRRPRDPRRLADDVRTMRDKMRAELDRGDDAHFDIKHGRGGIVDVEFIVQYCVLNWAHAHPRLVRHTDNLSILEDLVAEGLLDARRGEALAAAYRRLLLAEHRLKLMARPARVDAGEWAAQRRTVTEIWDAVLGGAR